MNSHMGVLSNVLISGKSNVIDLEYHHEGRHYIIYRNTAAGLYVLDFVHSSRDLESIIQELSESNRIDFLSQRLKPNSRLVTQVPAQTL